MNANGMIEEDIYKEKEPLTKAFVSPGERLRSARELSGQQVEDIAAQLRLRVCIVVALEKDEYHKMPKLVFARGYLRSYAKLVGLPADDLVRDFETLALIETPVEIVSPLRYNFKKPPKNKNRTKRLHYLPKMAVVVGLICLLVFWGFWRPFVEHVKQVVSAPAVASKVVNQPMDKATAAPAMPSQLPKVEPFIQNQ